METFAEPLSILYRHTDIRKNRSGKPWNLLHTCCGDATTSFCVSDHEDYFGDARCSPHWTCESGQWEIHIFIKGELEPLYAKDTTARDFHHHFHNPCPPIAYQAGSYSCYAYQIVDLLDEDHLDGRMFTREMLSRMKISLKLWVLLKTTFGPDNPKHDGNKAVYQVDLRRYDYSHPDSGRKNDFM